MLTLLEPATQEPLAEVAIAGPEDVDRAVASAHRVITEGPWRRLNSRERMCRAGICHGRQQSTIR